MRKRSVLIILALTALVYSNTLFNGLVGDDEVIFQDNDFYASWSNARLLLSPAYNTPRNEEAVFFESKERFHSGSVAYRPVLSLSYFLDYTFWKNNPRGYHFDNVVLHALNALLVYWLAAIFVSEPAAVLAALLFSLHPTKAEAVNIIGYRADLLACLFGLLSFIFFVKTDRIRSGIFFLLALFSKESAAVLPLLFLGYQWIFQKKITRQTVGTYAPFVGIFLLYGYLYFFIFPNTALIANGLPWTERVAGSATAFSHYLLHLVFPFSFTLLPPVYQPAAKAGPMIAGVLAAIFFVYLIGNNFKKEKSVAFFILWFLIALIPVANLIPLPTPMAHRFLYLPSVGLAAVAAFYLQKADMFFKSGSHAEWGKIIKIGVVALCGLWTFSLNSLWHSNRTAAVELVRQFPGHPQGYFFAGIDSVRRGKAAEAKEYLEKSHALGMQDPRLYYLLGMLHTHTDPERARMFFQKNITQYPSFASSYIGLGRVMFFGREYKEALQYLQKSIELRPSYTAYGYLIQLHLLRDDRGQALAVLDQAKKDIRSSDELNSLRKMIQDYPGVQFPVDIGI